MSLKRGVAEQIEVSTAQLTRDPCMDHPQCVIVGAGIAALHVAAHLPESVLKVR